MDEIRERAHDHAAGSSRDAEIVLTRRAQDSSSSSSSS
jgi:hypothetical protein